ncbi:MAG: hypothetical protein GXO75_13375, partial [Calditrichaeota bacterium]|nr:hypothetical protein [Calditrichota bacterium]
MHRTGIRMAASILFVLMFTLSCARQIPEKRFVNENARFDLLIGGETSDFKDDIVSRLVERYKGGGNIDIVNFTRLKQVQCGDYDVILVMDS